MQIPKLNIPTQSNSPSTSILGQPSQLKNWISQLPLANGAETARLLLETLRSANRSNIVAIKRFRGLEMLRPLISNAATVLKKEYGNAPLPLSGKNALLAELSQQLLTETANGYKILLMEGLLGQKQVPNPYEYFIPSLYQAMAHLAEILLDSYALYAPQPANTWLELHQLYLYAECANLDQLRLKLEQETNAPQTSIGDLYRRIVLLALANPYHLIPGETNKVFHALQSLAPLCDIVSCMSSTPPLGSHYVDLTADGPPIFVTKTAASKQFGEGRLIDASEVVLRISAQIEALKSSSRDNKVRSTLLVRAQRDMYARMLKAWRSRNERKSPRTAQPAEITIVTGLTACHNALSEGKAFTPEKYEMALRKEAQPKQAMDLISYIQKPWEDQIKVEELEAGAESTQQALFGSPKQENDVWQQVYFGAAQRSSMRNEQIAVKHMSAEDVGKRNVTCKIINTSSKGIALIFGLDIYRSQTRVGDLAAMKIPASNETGHLWSIAAIRWLRTSQDDRVELGLEVLCDDAVPIAVKALEGVGRGSEYFRALLIPRTEAYAKAATLIAPPSIYDIDSVLIMNTQEKLMRLRLTKVLEETSSFARYDFKMLPN